MRRHGSGAWEPLRPTRRRGESSAVAPNPRYARTSRHGRANRGARGCSARRRDAVAAASARAQRRRDRPPRARRSASSRCITVSTPSGTPCSRREGRWMAAVLAAGKDAVLSHVTAGGAWVHAPARRRRHPRHRPRRRRPQTPTRHPHPPQPHAHPDRHHHPPRHPDHHAPSAPSSTSPPPSKRLPLEQALDQADRRGLIDFAELKARPIPRSLQAILARYTGPTFTRSELEDRFYALCDNHGLPRPISNTIIEGEDVDFAWRPNRASSSRSTATATTAPRRASRTTANATSCSPSPAGTSCASPGPKSRPAPTGSPRR